MTDLGNIAVLFLLGFSGFAMIAGFAGGALGRPRLARAAENALLSAWGMATIGLLALMVLLYRSDFTVEYVWGHSNRDLPLFYKVTGLWAGQEGSLLFWNWVLLTYGALAVLFNRHKNRALMPYVVGVAASSAFFFALVNNFVANPFNVIALVHADGSVAALPNAPPDGRGLNPLLQHPAMVIHPPVLYFGYIGFIIPFAFCVAALITRQLGNAWITVTRRWTLVPWMLLGAGILMGGRWAYVELGWGGYWAWDPVENASLMPWLVGTAYIHSVMIQEKYGMLKVWNVVLILMSYSLAIFGTFTTRSGIMSSVHAFASSSIGSWFVGYIGILVAFTTVLLLSRLKDLKTENRFESMISRESAFLYNNMALLAACFAVFAGTMFPVFSEAITGEKIIVGAPYFDRIMTPLGLLILFLTGVGPLIPWRRCSLTSLWRNLAWPLAFGAAVSAAIAFAGMRHGWALVSFGICAFVLATIVVELWKGARVRAHALGASVVAGVIDLTRRNKRRYGGYFVHFALVLIFIGFTGKAFDTETKVPVKVGDTVSIRGYDLKIEEIVNSDTSDPNFEAGRMSIRLTRGGHELAVLEPESRHYYASEQTTSEVARWGNIKEDVYTVFVRSGPNDPPEVQVFVNPLVRFVWVGAMVMFLGGLVCLIPNWRPRLRAEPVGQKSTAIEGGARA